MTLLRTPRRSLCTALVGSVVAGAAALGAPAPAGAGGLTAATTLAPAGAEVALAADASGNAVAAWVAGGAVQVSRRTPGAPWSPAATVSPAGVSAADPDVSMGPDGTAAVVWVATEAGVPPNVELTVQPPGQGWLPARRVSDNANWTDRDPQVEVGPAGVATVVWAATRADGASIVRSKTASATSISGQSALVPDPVPGVTFSGLSLARNGTGDTVAAWRREGAAGVVEAARRLAGQAWSALAAISAPGGGVVPDATSVAVDGAGNATVGWAQGVAADSAAPYLASWPKTAGAPGGAVPLNATSPGRRVQVAAASNGALAATWSAPTGLWYAEGGLVVAVTSAPVTSHSLTLSDTGAASVAFAAVGAGLSLAHRPAGGAWTAQAVPSATGSAPALAAHQDEATLAWAEGGSGPVQARTLDNGAPTAVHLTAPLRVLNEGTKIKAGWIGADTWSPITYELERRVATYRSAFSAPSPWLSTTATSAAYVAGRGETVCLRVRGVDTGGNVSPWSVPRCATTAVNDRTLKQKSLAGQKVWKTVRKAKGAYARDYSQSTRKGATLTLPVTARRVALLVATGRGHGRVSVSLGKERLGSFSLASAKASKQVVIPVAVFSGVREGRLKITVTTQGKPVRIDGVYAGPV